MSIQQISIQNFRNINTEKIPLCPNFNFITGFNGSGKTSLLESIYLLSTGRSFRTHKINNLICNEEPDLEITLFGCLTNINNSTVKSANIGIRKSKSSYVIRLDGENIKSASSLAKLSPTLVIDPTSFNLLLGVAKNRRKFIDWGVFHVEHEFSSLWNQYIYCLKQRNTLLRTAKIADPQIIFWDEKISELGEIITLSRINFTDRFIVILNEILAKFDFSSKLSISYYKGWDKALSLRETLEKYRIKDIEKKYTQFGPHRSDLLIYLDKKRADEILSRGQQKILIIAMHLAKIKYLSMYKDKKTVLLIDDITAELDKVNLERVFDQLLELETQVFCTLLDAQDFNLLTNQIEIYKMFHVEHGSIEIIQ